MTSGAQLYGASILGADTEYVESLTSFCTRLALAHGWSVRTIFRIVSADPRGTDKKTFNWPYHNSDARAMNTYGNLQRSLTALLVKFTHIDELATCSLSHIGPSFAANAMGAVKRERHWCSSCFFDARKSDSIAYDMLIWQMADLKICPIHFCTLDSQCHGCGSFQIFFPGRGALDICGSCGAWLGQSNSSGTSAALPDISYQRWLSKEYSDLILARNQLAPRLMGAECSIFINSMAAFRQMTTVDLSKYSEIPLNTLYQWSENRIRPRLDSWARLCANLNAKLTLTVLDPAEAARQLELPFRLPKIYVATRRAPRARHSKEEIKSAVAEQLRMKKPAIQSIPKLALQLNVPISMLYFHAPSEIKALSSKLYRLQKKRADDRKKSLIKALQRAAERLRSKNVPITRRALMQEVRTRQKVSRHSVKKHFTESITFTPFNSRSELCD